MDCEGWKVKFCKNEARPGRKLCHACAQRKNTENNPMMVAYHNLKSHANARFIFFKVSYNHWVRFCIDNKYIEKKGTGANDLTVDRIIPEKGYIDGNIQALPNSQNVKKRFTDAKNKYKNKTLERDPDVPF